MFSIFHFSREIRKLSYLYLTFSRENSRDSNYVRQLAAQIIDVGNKKQPVDDDRSKTVAKQILDNKDIVLAKKKPNPTDSPKDIATKIITGLPDPPTTCCLSGCANCVWLEYADKLSKYFENGDEEAIATINKEVMDENLKAFILYELRMRRKK